MKESAKYPPPLLGVINVRPEHLKLCFESLITGAKYPCKWPPGTITLVRRTSGFSPARHYGVIGLWYYTGDSKARSSVKWPSKWNWVIQFSSIVTRFNEPCCELFEKPVNEHNRWLKESSIVPGLVFTALQGPILQVRSPHVAVGYINAILKEKKSELLGDFDYMGTTMSAQELLKKLRTNIKESATLNA